MGEGEYPRCGGDLEYAVACPHCSGASLASLERESGAKKEAIGLFPRVFMGVAIAIGLGQLVVGDVTDAVGLFLVAGISFLFFRFGEPDGPW